MDMLEYLKDKLRLEYLSDLTFIKELSELKLIVKSIPDDRHTLAEWSDAVKYITKSEAAFTSVTEAKEYLINY